MTILEEIVIFKKLEVARRKAEVKVSDLEDTALYKRCAISLKKSLEDVNKSGIIAEFKRRSPSRDTINDIADISEVSQAYSRLGASGLSILTDEKFFGGSSADLMKARENNIPILRKDFIIDEYQLLESKSIGADAILLIAACLTPIEIEYLANTAKSLGLEVVLEIHDEEELGHICEGIDIVGVNNRDLKTFEVDIQQSVRLADKIPGGKLKIAESGIRTTEDILLLRKHGFTGFLIGERFMKEQDPGKAFGDFVSELARKSEKQ